MDRSGAFERVSPFAAVSAIFVSLATANCANRLELASGAARLDAAALTDAKGQTGSGGRTDDGGHPGPCNPFLARELPVTLGTIVGVGKDSQQTLYVAEQLGSTDRVFISAGDTLYRRRVVGAGSDGDLVEGNFSFSYEAGTTIRGLLVTRHGGVATAMALGPGDSRGWIGDPGATDEMLTVLAPNAIDGMKLRNLPGEVVLEYLADVEDGSVIVVTTPRDDWTDKTYRLFYGTPNEMLERKIVGFYRGNDTDIVFLVGSTQFDVHFSFVSDYADGGYRMHKGPATLDTGNRRILSVTERARDGGWASPVSSLPGLSFVCLTGG